MGAIINRPVLLICSAILAEQEQLKDLSVSGIKVTPIVCGVGNVAAAIALTQYLEKNPAPDEILFVGSAGTYRLQSDEFRVGVSNLFFQRELAVVRSESNRPALMPASIETVRGSIASGLADSLHCVGGSTNCPDSITLVSPGTLFGEIEFENMECYGLSLVANQYGLPFSAFFAITNAVGPNGSESWRKNYREYSQELQKRLIRHLKSHPEK